MAVKSSSYLRHFMNWRTRHFSGNKVRCGLEILMFRVALYIMARRHQTQLYGFTFSHTASLHMYIFSITIHKIYFLKLTKFITDRRKRRFTIRSWVIRVFDLKPRGWTCCDTTCTFILCRVEPGTSILIFRFSGFPPTTFYVMCWYIYYTSFFFLQHGGRKRETWRGVVTDQSWEKRGTWRVLVTDQSNDFGTKCFGILWKALR